MIKIKKKLILIVIVLFLILGGFLFWHFSLPEPSFVIDTDIVTASEDQTELINNFGYPNSFILIMDQGVRYESWTYYEMERTFVFLDGKFLEEQIVARIEDENVLFPEFRPTQFKSGMPFSEVTDILGEPTAQGEISSDILEDALVYNYIDQVSVGTKGDKVVFVRTFPVFIYE